MKLLPRLLHSYRNDPDAGIHGAAEWLLRHWQATGQLKESEKELASGKVEGKRHWYINRQGQTMVVVASPGEFWMGEGQERHRQQIGRSFAISSTEVTVGQFLRFRKEHGYVKECALASDCPVNSVSWYDAVAYCNWLSEQEGIPKDQWCYVPNAAGQYAQGMRMPANYLQLTGYRLPTEAEWEYACRAGAETGYSFGEPEDLLGKYGWCSKNSQWQTWPVGRLKPNDLGLFDMHGNVWEWTQDVYKAYKSEDRIVTSDKEDKTDITNRDGRVSHGGSYFTPADGSRSANRYYFNGATGSRLVPAFRLFNLGFRPARTLLLGSFTALPPPPKGALETLIRAKYTRNRQAVYPALLQIAQDGIEWPQRCNLST